MRTTVRLAEDVYLAVKSVSKARGETFGEVLSDLARRGLESSTRIVYDDELPVFEVRENAPLLSAELVSQLRDDNV